MTADVELLPLPSVLLNWPHPTNHVAIRDYARANVAHATAAKDAEIEALRAEVAAHFAQACKNGQKAIQAQSRAERLTEALREYADPENWAMCEGKQRIWMEPGSSTPDAYHGHELACAALHPTAAQADEAASLPAAGGDFFNEVTP